ncbi:DsbA family protein [Chitinophaga nivalis]|uniref:DsbA family protein n=1 Tax=Chitinophaga nivalis TaxID=2991709 RepID=A0ABT3IRN2_9BACT|nr:DsbA family protein [Chitinophaga nivalis]MCW3463764.1 DsbA family protein [Chitinophaga nivalis]MCW3486546.1 DsbA family protein [Chitinophaga nivalis]
MRFIYVYDPLCGWCYGFTPVVQELQQRSNSDMTFDILSGGMIIGDNRHPFSHMAAFIQREHTNVEEMTGVRFGNAFLEKLLPSAEIMDSERPAVALTVFKEYQPENAISFAHDMQVALNYHGQSLNLDSTYKTLVKKFGLPEDEFINRLHDEHYRYATQQEFQLVQHWGITGYPAAILDTGKQLYLCARGFTTLERLQQTIDNIIAESNSL